MNWKKTKEIIIKHFTKKNKGIIIKCFTLKANVQNTK